MSANPIQPPHYLSSEEQKEWFRLTGAHGNPQYKEPFWYWPEAKSGWTSCGVTTTQQYAACDALYDKSWTPVVARVPPFMEDRRYPQELTHPLGPIPSPSGGVLKPPGGVLKPPGGNVVTIPEIKIKGREMKKGLFDTSGSTIVPVLFAVALGVGALGMALHFSEKIK